MKVFITNDYRDIYFGEFKKWVEENIIYPISKNHEVTISDSLISTKNYLLNNKYDLIINTGYNTELLRWIPASKDIKLLTTIYEMNMDKIFTIMKEVESFKPVIADKSKLIFLSSGIITPTLVTKTEIDSLYSVYKDKVKNIEKKVFKLDSKYTIYPKTRKYNKLIEGKYVVMPMMSNSHAVNILIPPLINSLDPSLSVKIMIITNGKINKNITDILKKTGYSNRIFIENDLSEEEKRNIYHYSMGAFFMSDFDVTFDEIFLALESESLVFLNDNNEFYHELCGDTIGYYNSSEDINKVFMYLRNMPKEQRKETMGYQNDLINKLNNYKPSLDIDGILYKVYQ